MTTVNVTSPANTVVVTESAGATLVSVITAGPQGATGATGATGPAGQGIAPGGTTNQVLAKASATNYDTTWITVAGTGTVTSVGTGTGLTGGPITTTGTIALANTAVTPNTYTLATVTVDQQGRITSASTGAVDLTYDAATRLLSNSGGTGVTLPLATTTDAGLESAADKSKLDSITVDTATVVRKYVRNNSGVNIPKGAAVYQTGSSGTTLTVALADASTEATAAQTLGLAQEAIANNANGFIVAVGLLDGIDTNALVEGQVIWLSETAGQITTTRPTQPAHGVVCGYCVKQGPGTSGILYVKVDNGLELSELHDVLITSATTGQFLQKAADGLWKPRTLVSGDVSGLGTAAVQNVGTGAGNVVQLDGSAKLPAVDGSALTNLPIAPTNLTYTASTRLLESSTGTDATLPLFSSTDPGLAPASGGGTSNFLRADGTWSAPVGGVTGVTATAPITSSGGSAPVISTSMATNRLLGRTTAGTGVAEEISVGSGLSLSAGSLSAPAPARAAALYLNTFCM